MAGHRRRFRGGPAHKKLKGIGRVYDHVTPEMRWQIIDALEAWWLASLKALRRHELRTLVSWFPRSGESGRVASGCGVMAPSPDTKNDRRRSSVVLVTSVYNWWAILGLNQ